MKKVITLSFLIFALISTPLLFAGSDVQTLWDNAQSDVYGTKAGGMLGRGVLNVVTCFVDVIVHTVEGSKQGPPVVGSLTGLGSGIACTALRVTSGALDLATFWVPGFNGFTVSRSYSNCLEVEEKAEAVAPAPEPAPTHFPFFQQESQPEPEPAAKKHDAMEYVKK